MQRVTPLWFEGCVPFAWDGSAVGSECSREAEFVSVGIDDVEISFTP
jgi:hypothetical protein